MNLQHKHSVLTGHSNSNLSNSNKILGLIQKSINKLYDRLETNIGKMNLKKKNIKKSDDYKQIFVQDNAMSR